MNALQRNRTHLFILACLATLTIITRLLLIAKASFIYNFDSYTYIYKAIDFASRGEIQLSAGMPFVIVLGVFFRIFGSTFGAILISRFLMLLMSTLLVCIIYLFGLKMSTKTFGFFAALLAIFEPYFFSYSIVPHNDVFVVAMGLVAFYFAASNTKFRYVLSPVFFYIAVFTRPEVYMILIVPLLMTSFLKHLRISSVRDMVSFVFFSSLFVLPSVWVYSIYSAVTRFGLIEKLTLFLQPELLNTTLKSAFDFYDSEFLNQAFFALIVLGLVLGFFNLVTQFIGFERNGKRLFIKKKKHESIKDVFLSDRVVVAFSLLLMFVLHIVVLTVYGYGYVIVGGVIEITAASPDRYLILSRLLMSYPLAYTLSIAVRRVYAEIARKK